MNLSLKERLSFITYNLKKPSKWGIHIYVLAGSSNTYVPVPCHQKITTESFIKPDLSPPELFSISTTASERLDMTSPVTSYLPAISVAVQLFPAR
jgi:hypothetical protein